MTVRNDTPLTDEQRAFINRNFGVAILQVNEYYKRFQDRDRDELKSLAALGLIHAARSYDATKSAESTFTKTCVRTQLFYREYTPKHTPNDPILSLDFEYTDGNDLHDEIPSGEVPTQVRAEHRDAVETVREAISLLPPEDREIIVLSYFRGLSDTQAGKHIQRTLQHSDGKTTYSQPGFRKRRLLALGMLRDILLCMGITRVDDLLPEEA